MDKVEAKVPLTVLIPIKNEALNLPRCLKSVSWASEILVVDSHSTDDSVQIARSFGAQVFQFDFSGSWPKKKNWALETLPIKYSWVFILDADEVLPPEAEAEIAEIVNRPCDPCQDVVGYWINRRCMFMNKWLRHAYYPNWNLRLFLHAYARYEKLTSQPTQSGDNEVHEHVIVQGRTGHLACEMDHYAFPTVEVFVEKHNRYSNWEARFALNQANNIETASSLTDSRVALIRRLKIYMQGMPFRPLLRFLYVYIWQRGFLDGIEGYYFARLHGFYEFLTVVKTYELKRSMNDSTKSSRKSI